MYPKKKKHHPFAVVFAVICIAVIFGAGFLLVSDTELSWPGVNNKPAYEPVVISGNVMAFTVERAALENAVGEPGREAHMQALDSVLNFAAENGYNSVLYEPSADDGLYCRVDGGEAAEYIKKCDKLFDKWDPMAYFCEGAAARGLAVFALYQNQTAADGLSAMVEEKYAVSGSYVKAEEAGQSAATAAYKGLNGEGVLFTPLAGADYYSLEKLPQTEGYFGLVSGSYADAGIDRSTLSLWASITNEAARPQPLSYNSMNELSLTYPTNTKTPIYTKTCYIMGTSNPDLPLTINGQEIPRFGTSGAFGYLLELKSGANAYTLAQGETKLDFTLTRQTYSGGGATGGADGTAEANKGQMIEITSGIASALTDPGSDSAISDTFKLGGKAIVSESVRTTRSGKKTWAYKLASGDYVLARNTKILDEAKKASFTGSALQSNEYGEIISFEGEGTPLCYTKLDGQTLKITFLDTDIAESFAISGSEYISAASVTKEENGAATLILQLTEKQLWGWDIRYNGGKTELFLKKAPKKSDVLGKPLSGVRVMLDAGHGEDDTGAMGVGGQTAPTEKDVNLSVTLAAKYYLEKLGAEVLLTRSDDNFKTLDERLAAQSEFMTDFFIAVHHNSVELTVDANQSAGTECYYFYDRYSGFSKTLSERVSAASQRQNRGEKYGYFYVTRTNLAPSVLLEVGFMVNPLEYEAITNDEIIAKTGEAIAMSIYNSVE